MNISPVEVRLFHANGQTDGQDEDNGRFRNFANAPKYGCIKGLKCWLFLHLHLILRSDISDSSSY